MCILYLIVYNFTKFRWAENRTPSKSILGVWWCAIALARLKRQGLVTIQWCSQKSLSWQLSLNLSGEQFKAPLPFFKNEALLLFGCFFTKFGIVIDGFSSETKELKSKNGVFWANYFKKHPIWANLGAILSKMVYWWVGNWAKNWYRESQIFKVRQGTSTYSFGESNPPGGNRSNQCTIWQAQNCQVFKLLRKKKISWFETHWLPLAYQRFCFFFFFFFFFFNFFKNFLQSLSKANDLKGLFIMTMAPFQLFC